MENDRLFELCKQGDLEGLKAIIDNNPSIDLDEFDSENGTLLHWAALKNYKEIIEYLISKGASMDIINESEAQTPLHWAAIRGSLQAFQALLREGCDINTADARGYNVLHHAAQYGRVLIALYAINKGVSVDSRDKEGRTPLHWAAYRGYLPMIRLLLRKGATIDPTDHVGRTPLHCASAMSNSDCAQALVFVGANPTAKTDSGNTPLDIAVRNEMIGSKAFFSRAEKAKMDKASMKRYANYWYLAAAFGIPMACLFLTYMPLILSAIVLIGGWFGLYNFVINVYPDKIKNYFHVTVFASAFVVNTFYVFFEAMSAIPERFLLLMFAVVLTVSTGVLYAKLVRSDPGAITPVVLSQEELERRIDEDPLSLKYFCPTCLSERPLRSKHCKLCDHCIARYERHSIWISNCIGAGNNKLYLLAIGSLLLLNVVMILVSYAMVFSSPDVPALSEFFSFVQFIVTDYMFTLIICVANIISLVYAGAMYGITLYCACKNSTYNELDKFLHYEHLCTNSEECEYVNPFDLGSVSANIQEFLFGGRDWYTYSFTRLVQTNTKV